MATTTGPVLALGAITMANQNLFHHQPVDWRVPVATGLLAGTMALMEKASPALASGLVWVALAAVLLTRVTPGVPSPAESFVSWWNAGAPKK